MIKEVATNYAYFIGLIWCAV